MAGGGNDDASNSSNNKRKLPTRENKRQQKKKKASTSKMAKQGLQKISQRDGEAIKVKAEAVSDSKNYTREEDELICKAFVSVTTDPVKGASQKGSTFWQAVHRKFYLPFDEEASMQVPRSKRWTWQSV